MLKHLFQSTVVIIALVSIVGCSATGSAKVLQSNQPREMTPDVSDSAVDAVAEGNQAFALDLYRYLKNEQSGNLFYSPHSISIALAMTYAGARGETETEMAETLHFTLPQDKLHPAFNALDLVLASRGEDAEGKDDEGFRLRIANRLWGQEGYDFLDQFLDTLARNYGAGLGLLDFSEDPEGARQTINDWVSDETEERIEDLLPPGSIMPATRLVLANAIYFNAAWAEPFEEDDTADGPFTTVDGQEVTVPMMHQTARFPYAEVEGIQAIELPYDGHEIGMVILLPPEGDLARFEDQLDGATLEDLLRAMDAQQVALTMPQFEFESRFKLNDALKALGMPSAFSGAADFSGMTGDRSLFIGSVHHKAFVGVDEAGTEAAAATAVVMLESAAPADEPVEMTLDHPFIFLIRDRETGAILFVGRIADPTA